MSKTLASIVAAGMALSGSMAYAQEKSPTPSPPCEYTMPAKDKSPTVLPQSAYGKYWTDYEKYPLEKRVAVAGSTMFEVLEEVCDVDEGTVVFHDRDNYFSCEQTRCTEIVRIKPGYPKCTESQAFHVYVPWSEAINPTIVYPPGDLLRVVVSKNPDPAKQYIEVETMERANALKLAIEMILYFHNNFPACLWPAPGPQQG